MRTISFTGHRVRLHALVVAVFLLLALDPVRADLNNGIAAYQRGDFSDAIREFRVAAEDGDANAQFNVGFMFFNGQGVPQDYSQAIKWYLLAAAQGEGKSQAMLGYMYSHGQGVPQDYSQAIKWYLLAAAQGFADAQYNLGVMYDQGHGVPQDYQEAVKWYRRAANQGSALAIVNLALSYYNGEGVPQDRTTAYALASLAAASGHDTAPKTRDIIRAEMTPAEVAAGQALAREMFRPGNLLKALDAYLAK